MVIRYVKFVKMAKETNICAPDASLDYLETSTWVDQEHNGFSYQNPLFIGVILNLKANGAHVYLPSDTDCLSPIAHCVNSRNYISLIVGSKQSTAIWLNPEEAEIHCGAGGSIRRFCSTDEGPHPDVVLVRIGTEFTFEAIAAAALLRKIDLELPARVVNVTYLMALGPFDSHPHVQYLSALRDRRMRIIVPARPSRTWSPTDRDRIKEWIATSSLELDYTFAASSTAIVRKYKNLDKTKGGECVTGHTRIWESNTEAGN